MTIEILCQFRFFNTSDLKGTLNTFKAFLSFFSIGQLVEYCYLIGMHVDARGLSELANSQDLFSTIENSYSDKEIFTSKSW